MASAVVGILEPPLFPVVALGQRQASRTKRLDRSRKKRPPTEREDGTADKSDSGEHKRTSGHKALFKEQSGPDRLPPSLTSLCLHVGPRVGNASAHFAVLSGARADSWSGKAFQESQVEFCVKQRSVIERLG